MKQLVKRIFAGLGPASTPDEQAHNAFVISLVTAAFMAITALNTYAYFWLQDLAPRGVEVFAAYTVAALFSAWLSRAGRARLGIVILLATILFAVLPYRDIVLPGQGLTVALMITIAVTGISVVSLPAGWSAVAILASLFVGAGYILYDYYGVKLYIEPEYGMTLAIGAIETFVYASYARGFIKTFGLRTRLVLAFIVVALVPLIVLSVMNSQRLSTLQNDEARRELTESSTQLAAVIDNFLQTQMDVVRTEARLVDLRSFVLDPSENDEEVQSILRTLSLKDPVFISSYGILDRQGNNLLDTNGDYIGMNESNRPYFHTPMISGRPYVSTVLFYNGHPHLYVSAPLRDDNGEIVGLLRAEYNAVVLQWLVRQNARQDVHAFYSVLVEDENYLRLAHSSAPRTLYRSYMKLAPLQVETQQKLGRLPSGTPEELSTLQQDVVDGLQGLGVEPFFTGSSVALAGEQTYSTAQRLTRAPWLVLTRMSVTSVRQAVTSQTRTSVVLALLSALMVALVGLGVTQVLAAPIVRLTRVAERVAGGDLTARASETSQDEIGMLAQTFNKMTIQLQDTLTGLEQRVAERTRALELSADISRRLSTILDPAQLVAEVVDLLQFAFSYYHVHIYLLDEHQENLVMVGGTGEAGKTMLAAHHSLPFGRGLVGQACETGDVVLVADTQREPNWLPNPLLPETRSELAVPILLGDDVLGALDVQQNVVNGLSRQDADLLRGIAIQLAIALRNARQYEESQRQAQQEALTASIVDEIQKTQSMPEALQVAVRELGRALQVPQTGVRLHSGAGGNGGASSNGGANDIGVDENGGGQPDADLLRKML